ncbi:MAG TPA: M3 family metallopeptidase [Christiangramia sp.]|nr:M3 family metallopeptidase [Christiangramia sp.]
MDSQNILLSDFEYAPFSEIKTEDYKPAILKAVDLAKKEIEEIAKSSEKPTFKNTIEALEFSGEKLDRVTSIFFNINSAETNEEIQKIAQEVSPILSEFKNDVILNKDLFKRIKEVFEAKETLDLTIEQSTLLDKKYKAFTRNGANLPEEKQEELREIDKELSKLKLKFGENVLAETNKYELQVTDESRLKGLPESFKDEARSVAKLKDKEGWIFTLEYPSYIPFMKYAEDRDLRKELALAFGSRGFHNDELDNQQNVLQIAKLRYKRAQLLGFESHAHFVLEERMAETPEKVDSFLNEMLEKAKPAAEREFKELENFAKELDNIDQLQKWDSAFYSEKLKQKLFNLDDEKLKPYFKLENVIDGVFTVAGKLYGLISKK